MEAPTAQNGGIGPKPDFSGAWESSSVQARLVRLVCPAWNAHSLAWSARRSAGRL